MSAVVVCCTVKKKDKGREKTARKGVYIDFFLRRRRIVALLLSHGV